MKGEGCSNTGAGFISSGCGAFRSAPKIEGERMDENMKSKVYEYLNKFRTVQLTQPELTILGLRQKFGFTRREAKNWVWAWMKDF